MQSQRGLSEASHVTSTLVSSEILLLSPTTKISLYFAVWGWGGGMGAYGKCRIIIQPKKPSLLILVTSEPVLLRPDIDLKSASPV